MKTVLRYSVAAAALESGRLAEGVDEEGRRQEGVGTERGSDSHEQRSHGRIGNWRFRSGSGYIHRYGYRSTHPIGPVRSAPRCPEFPRTGGTACPTRWIPALRCP